MRMAARTTLPNSCISLTDPVSKGPNVLMTRNASVFCPLLKHSSYPLSKGTNVMKSSCRSCEINRKLEDRRHWLFKLFEATYWTSNIQRLLDLLLVEVGHLPVAAHRPPRDFTCLLRKDSVGVYLAHSPLYFYDGEDTNRIL